MKSLPVFRQSELKTFRECPKKFEFSQRKDLVSTIEPKQFVEGRLMHSLMEFWVKDAQFVNAHEINDYILTSKDEKALEFKEMFMMLYEDYKHNIPQWITGVQAFFLQFENVRNYRTEVNMQATFDGLFTINSTIDIMFDYEACGLNLTAICDYKFNSKVSDIYEPLYLDMQQIIYHLVAVKNGIQTDDMIRYLTFSKEKIVEPSVCLDGRVSTAQICTTRELYEEALLKQEKPISEKQKEFLNYRCKDVIDFFAVHERQIEPHEYTKVMFEMALTIEKIKLNQQYNKFEITPSACLYRGKNACQYMDVCKVER